MSAWRSGKIQWFSDEFEEGMIIDCEDGEFYYLNISAAKKIKELNKKRNKSKDIKFKLNSSKRSRQASDIKLVI